METLRLIWTFMAEGVVISVLSAVVLPILGAVLCLRRTAFLGVAVPQFSAAGIALGLALLPAFPTLQEWYLDHGHPPLEYLFVFAAGAAGLALLAFSSLEGRRDETSGESRVAAGFALAAAAGLLFLEAAPAGGSLVETLQRGSVVVADWHALLIVAVVDALVLIGWLLFGRGILLVSFDRDGAVALGHRPGRYETIWNVLVGLAIGVGVMTIGPVLVFGLLFLPAVFARAVARSQRGYLRSVVALALPPVLVAWPVSFHLDLPYGPTAVIGLIVVGAPVLLVHGLRKRRVRGGR